MVYTTENTYKSLIARMDSLNLNILDRVLLGRLLIFPAQTTASGWNPTDIFDVLLKDIVQHSAVDLVVVDSITSLYVAHPDHAGNHFFRGVQTAVRTGEDHH